MDQIAHSEFLWPCLHELFERQVAERPDHPAVEHQGETLTYRELNERANRIAHKLMAKGAGRDSIIGLYMARSHQMIVAILAILKSGAAYMPLDPAYPADRTRFMLADSGATVVVTESPLRGSLPDDVAVSVLTIDDDFAAEPDDNPQQYDSARLAYVIYTSGSTGQPKGVLIEHRSAASYVEAARRTFGTRPDDRALLFNSISFDPSVQDIFAALASGATLVVRSDNMARSAGSFIEGIRSLRISALSLPTAFWREVITGIDSFPASIRYCVIGGEACYPQHVARWRALTDAPLWNAYGPTETTIALTMSDVTKVETSSSVPIGRPVPGVELYLLDEQMRPVAVGAKGEICASGIQLSRGYHKRHELTAARFVPNPFKHGARLYKTGDFARVRPDGLIEFLGRADGQVKLRGYRIELSEIEAALGAMGAEAVVSLLEDPTGESRLVAYVVADLAMEALRQGLAAALPGHMLPDQYVRLERLPIGPGGKIDRNALPAPDWSTRADGLHSSEPATELERRLVAMWSEALGRSSIGTDENLFDLGAHSLLAIRVFTRIEKETGLVLPPAILYEAPTISSLAKFIEGLRIGAQKLHCEAAIPIQPKGSKPPIFCVGGGVVNLSNLARALGPDQPFYALQWRALPDDILIESSLSKIAAFFVSAVRAVEPVGPYYIFGSFTAGMIAVEMARQLTREGAQVATLAVFDTEVSQEQSRENNSPRETSARKRSVVRKILGVLARGPRQTWMHVTNPYYVEQLQIRFCKLALAAYLRAGKQLPLWMRSGMGEEFFIQRSTNRHVPPEAYSGDLELFLTPALLKKFSRLERFGWGRWIAGAVHVHEVPGEPCFIMLSPNVEHLAAELSQCLEEYRRNSLYAEAYSEPTTQREPLAQAMI
jgi:amino acid adenylation domain-containing protein